MKRCPRFILLVIGLLGLSYAQRDISIKMGDGAALDLSSLSRSYYETFSDSPESILDGILIRQHDTWHMEMSAGRYTISNNSDPGVMRYYAIAPMRGTAAELEVSGEYGDLSGAGLLYSFDADTSTFYALGISGRDSYALYRNDPEGFQRLRGGTHPAIREDKNRLAIVINGREARLYINNSLIGSLTTPADPTPDFGLFVAGTGSYSFHELSAYSHESDLELPDRTSHSPSDPFSGSYSGDDLRISLQLDTDGYSGSIHLGEQSFSLRARRQGDTLTGSFSSAGTPYTFSATLIGDTLEFRTGSSLYRLERQ